MQHARTAIFYCVVFGLLGFVVGVTLRPAQGDSYVGQRFFARKVFSVTGNLSIDGRTHSGGVLTNPSAGSTVTITLPSVSDADSEGMWITGICDNSSQVLRFDPQAGENIVYSGGTVPAGNYIELDASFSIIVLHNNGSEWVTSQELGSISEE